MASGIQILNRVDGSVQITNVVPTLMLAYKGTVTTNPTAADPPLHANSETSAVVFSRQCYAPVIAYRAIGKRVAIGVVNAVVSDPLVKSDWTFRLYAREPAGCAIDYWIFDLAKNGVVYDSTAARLETYADGELAYSSRMRPLKIVSVLPVPTPFNPNTGYTINGPAGDIALAQFRASNGQSRDANIQWSELQALTQNASNQFSNSILKWIGNTSIGPNYASTGNIGAYYAVNVAGL